MLKHGNLDSKLRNLFVLDLANNHQGSIDHGLAIIREMSQVAKENDAKVAIKFQYRDLDSFIHPSHKEKSDNKHIPRFLSTKLIADEFKILKDEASKLGLLTACTPFDEKSVDYIEQHDFDIIKIASCSVKDKPLLKRISLTDKPIIFSTAGANIKDIDYAVNLFEQSNKEFAIMHCVAIYPTPIEKLELNQIDLLKERYSPHIIGYSTHEDPNDTTAVQIAIAKGASILERHVGKTTDTIQLNKYSSTKEQVDLWIKAAKKARIYCGQNEKVKHTEEELDSLQSLERGVYLKNDTPIGKEIGINDVYFAMPRLNGQMASGNFKEGIITEKDYKKDGSLDAKLEQETDKEDVIANITQQTKHMLRSARIHLGDDYSVELSHHYGINRFNEFGLVMINCMDRSYCKKLLIQVPGQFHPEHLHSKKEETFQLLYGDLEVSLEGTKTVMKPGDKLIIEIGKKHSFSTINGAIIEEVSTKYEKGGSEYTDPQILSGNPDLRKTYLGKL